MEGVIPSPQLGGYLSHLDGEYLCVCGSTVVGVIFVGPQLSVNTCIGVCVCVWGVWFFLPWYLL